MSEQKRWLLGQLLSSTAIVGASAFGLTLAAGVNKALAACDNATPTEGQTVTCSGADATGVYAAGTERYITVNVEAGASISPGAGVTPIDLNGSSSVNLDAGSSAYGDMAHGIAFTDNELYSSGLWSQGLFRQHGNGRDPDPQSQQQQLHRLRLLRLGRCQRRCRRYGRRQCDCDRRQRYVEQGLGGFGLTVQEQEAEALRVAGALTMTHDAELTLEGTSYRFSHEYKLGVAHEEALDDRLVSATALGTPLSIQGDDESRTLLTLGAGLSFKLTENAAVFAGYDGQFGGDFASHGFNAGLRVNW